MVAPTSDHIPLPVPIITLDDDGRYWVGLDDAAPGPFPTRAFACAAAQRAEAARPP